MIKNVYENGEYNRVIKLNEYSDNYKCDQLYVWFHKMFQMWERDLDVNSLFI